MPSKPAVLTPEEQDRRTKHVQITDAFVKAFEEQFQQKYVHQGPRDGSPLKAFILAAPEVTPERFVEVARGVWNGQDRWMRENLVTISMLCSQWNKASVRVTPTTAGEEGEW